MKGFFADWRVLLGVALVAATQGTVWWLRGYGLAGSILTILALQLAYGAGTIRERKSPRESDILLDILDDAYKIYKEFTKNKPQSKEQEISEVSEKVLR